ncbi:hypothetical protein Tco_0513343, partial [Tanacetum coccineum]
LGVSWNWMAAETPRVLELRSEFYQATIDVDKYGEIDDNGLGLAPLIREHENYMEALARKLKCNGMGITDPFAIVKESKEMYLEVVSLVDDHTCVRSFNYGRLCRNGKNFALTEGDVTIQYHYGYLRSYAKALVE